MNCANPKCGKKVTRIKKRIIDIEYLKLENGRLVEAIGEFEEQKKKDDLTDREQYFCPHCDHPLKHKIRSDEKAIQILSEDC